MAITYSTAAAQASATNTAGSTTTGSWIDITACITAVVLAKITNGGTGPTVACTCSIDLSPDNGSTVYAGAGGSFTAGTTSSTTYTGAFDVTGNMYFRTVFSGNTAQSVTVQADVEKRTA